MSDIIEPIVNEYGIRIGIVVAAGCSLISLIIQIVKGIVGIKRDKSLAKYSSSLERKKKAYEFRLDKEFTAYDNIVDELSVITINTFESNYYIQTDDWDLQHRITHLRDCRININVAAMSLKSHILKGSPYIDNTIFGLVKNLIAYIGTSTDDYNSIAKTVVENGEIEENAFKVIEEHKDRIIQLCETINYNIKLQMDKSCQIADE